MMTLMTDVGPYPYEGRTSYDSYHSHHRHRHFYASSAENEYLQSYANDRERDDQTIQRTASADSNSLASAGSVGSVHYRHDNLSRFVLLFKTTTNYFKKIRTFKFEKSREQKYQLR